MPEDKNITQNNPTQPPNEVYGKDAIIQALAMIDFPISKLELINHFGNKEIEYYKGCSVKLKEVIYHCNYQNEKFDSRSYLILLMCAFLEKELRMNKL